MQCNPDPERVEPKELSEARYILGINLSVPEGFVMPDNHRELLFFSRSFPRRSSYCFKRSAVCLRHP